MARTGSCALLCVVVDNELYVGNAGDSLGILVERDTHFELNTELNANNGKERARLRERFPQENDVVICKRENTACYVKGRLQPTRSIGDLRLKHKEFNNPKNYSR